MGRCVGCGEWDTLVEERVGGRESKSSSSSGRAVKPRPLREVELERGSRLSTGFAEFDRVLGGGIVPGSLVLIGGAPGIGKSTLLNQALARLSASGIQVLYISGEESAAQVRLRAERLDHSALDVPVVTENNLSSVLSTLEKERPKVCVIDSVQVMHSDQLVSTPGSVAQVREVTAALMRLAKELEIAILLVGHVTKDGGLAGPRVLEHMVDCVLQFDGDRQRIYRVLRAHKNRFGSATELALFEMSESGLDEVKDASALLIEQSTGEPGSCFLATIEGSRPLLVEVQALVSPTEAVPPRRVAQGIDRNRLSLVLAVLARHGRLPLGNFDVFVNVAGGIDIDEPGADLAVALAIASAAKRQVIGGLSSDGAPTRTAVFAELGLTGELRYVTHPDRRLKEAAKFGVELAITPVEAKGAVLSCEGLEVKACKHLREALAVALPSKASTHTSVIPRQDAVGSR